MEKRTGNISVHTENIFPIIKKSLYANHEIFLRELVSNAVDATQKIKTLASLNEFQGELGNLQVKVALDEAAKTITITDSGIGMTADDIEKYINQVAFSGASEFVAQYKDKTELNQMIGQFGLGFYSAFMVASKVEIQTLAWKPGSEPASWVCDGSTAYEIGAGTKNERGTAITLHISEDGEEFLNKNRIEEILNKYAKFLPVEVVFEDKVINTTAPLWTKKPATLTDEDYIKFYEELYPFSEKPLFWIHLNVDYPFNLTGILYFPKIKQGFEVQKNKIQLYSNQVFITDAVDDIVPEYLRLLHGVIDSPDIPLNVSRSFLQTDSNVKKINSHITKKVADKLLDLFKNDRTTFESKWQDLEVFIKFGTLSDEKFAEKSLAFSLFADTDNKLYTWDELKAETSTNQTDKNGKWVVLYTNDIKAQHAYIIAAQKRHYKVIQLSSILDSHFVGWLENKSENTTLKRVDSATIDQLIEKEIERTSLLTAEKETALTDLFKQIVPEMQTVKPTALATDDFPVQITKSEFMRRYKEMSIATGGGNFGFDMPEPVEVVVNTAHPYILKLTNETDVEKQKKLAQHAYDLALLGQGMLTGAALTQFMENALEQA